MHLKIAPSLISPKNVGVGHLREWKFSNPTTRFQNKAQLTKTTIKLIISITWYLGSVKRLHTLKTSFAWAAFLKALRCFSKSEATRCFWLYSQFNPIGQGVYNFQSVTHGSKAVEKLRFMICFASLFKSTNFVRLSQMLLIFRPERGMAFDFDCKSI